jgi:hypothetical protein
MDARATIQKASDDVTRRLREHVRRRGPLCVVKAPPGSGKTYTLLEAVAIAYGLGERVAVATQTNAQADDACRRLLSDHRAVKEVVRFGASGSSAPEDLDGKVRWVTETKSLPAGRSVVVATTAKWSLVNLPDPFDILFVDEAWQMAWCDFMLLKKAAPRFVLIGDPGQIPPVVTIPVERWETSPRAPHRPAPELILADPGIKALSLDLPCCRRLPADSVDLVRPFYDFEFRAWARPGERFVRATTRVKKSDIDRVIDRLGESSAAVATLPTRPGGPPLEYDREVADLAAKIVGRLLQRGALVADRDGGKAAELKPCDIGISATHRVMNSALHLSLPSKCRDMKTGIRVDTPERWQGLERKVMVVVHPLSGVVRPSAFDLETGRLCVMASRHRAGMIVVSRDHVPQTLQWYFPAAEQAVGRPDVTGRGHWQNLRFWETLAERGCVVAFS